MDEGGWSDKLTVLRDEVLQHKRHVAGQHRRGAFVFHLCVNYSAFAHVCANECTCKKKETAVERSSCDGENIITNGSWFLAAATIDTHCLINGRADGWSKDICEDVCMYVLYIG